MTLNAPEYIKDVIYLEGNPTSTQALERACIRQAESVVILNDKLSFDATYSDTNIILQAMIIRNYLQQKPKAEVKICMQLLKPESITHYKLSLDSDLIKDDQIVCVEQMKFSLMAKSCLCPGLVALITNLIKSNDEKKSIGETKDDKNYKWMTDYQQG